MSTAQIRIDDVVRLIVASGDVTATWFQHEDCAKFEHGDRWVSFCGTIAAFAFVIVYEVSVRNGPGLATPEQASSFQAIEDDLYKVYKAGFSCTA